MSGGAALDLDTLAIGELDDFSRLMEPVEIPASEVGRPLELDPTLVDPDPTQVRGRDNPGFSDESIQGLADTIRSLGQQQPISVCPHPGEPGRYRINHGERRWRAVSLLGDRPVLAFIDENQSDDGRIIENIQREDLTPREIADYIGRKLSAGMSAPSIAKMLGKGTAWVYNHKRLLDLVAPLDQAFSTGRLRDVDTIAMLDRALKTHPEEVRRLVHDGDIELTRRYVQKRLDSIGARAKAAPKPEAERPARRRGRPSTYSGMPVFEHEGREVRLLTDRRPKSVDCVWIEAQGGSPESVPVDRIVFRGLVASSSGRAKSKG